jgi:catechol 2,3-dioxygenase-like lactoylglutathione lyase family enzyme
MTRHDDVLDAQLSHCSTMIVVRDLAASEAFYVQYFGFNVVQKLEHLRLLQRPGMSLYLVTEGPPTADKPGVTLAPLQAFSRPPVNLIFHVRDVRATYSALAEKGLGFLTPPQQPPWGGWRVFAQDPDGYLIEIEQADG